MIFHENPLKYYTLFFSKFGKMLQSLPSAAIYALSVKWPLKIDQNKGLNGKW